MGGGKRSLFDGSTGWYFWAQSEPNLDVRDYFEAEWERASPFVSNADQFLVDVRTQFNARTWELRVACALMDAGHALACPPREGAPDVLVDGQPRVWVEARAATPGEGDDAAARVYSYRIKTAVGERGMFNIDRRKIVMRVTGAVRDKAIAHAGYVTGGHVRGDEPYIVAVNAGQVPDAGDGPEEVPVGVLALFGYGEPVLMVPIDVGQGAGEPHGEWRSEPVLTKSGGAPVPTVGFLDGSIPHVSAVIFSSLHAVNVPANVDQHEGERGRDLVLIHDRHATNPLPRGWLGCGREYWVEDDGRLGFRDYRKEHPDPEPP